jgi:DNA-binding NtrC family response regulator
LKGGGVAAMTGFCRNFDSMAKSKTETLAGTFRIFVVEDDEWYGELLVHHLSLNPDYSVTRFTTAKEAMQQLHLQPAVVTLDYSLPDINGDEALKQIRALSPDTSVIIISGQENISTALGMLRLGAYDYLVKDDETRDRLWNIIGKIRQKYLLERQIDQLRDQIGQQYSTNRWMVGSSKEMKQVYNLIEKAAKTNITVSISGATGTGKELVARSIHFSGSRSRKPFIAVNMSGIPRELLESELFGYEKGAFTGANERRKGRFEEADQGTLFLDEIAEMDIALQSKLLRVLQEREVTRLGSNLPVAVDVRIICATHKDLATETRKGNFREDLYYRLLGLPIHLPALRERQQDILILAKHFLDLYCDQEKIQRKQLSEDARSKLMNYPWPGNVRELKAVIELAAVLTDGQTISANDLSLGTLFNNDQLQAGHTLEEMCNRYIRQTLDHFDGNVIEAAKKLDIAKSKIYNLIKEGKV